MPPQNPDDARWFASELQPHEAMLRAWLASQYGGNVDVDDIIQEAYLRVLRAHAATPVRSPKAFLFVTARNLALMQLRHRGVQREDSLAEIDGSSIVDESPAIPHAVARAQELELLTKAIQSLPTRCRQIITLRKIYAMSLKEVAAELGIAEHTVEIQTGLGLKKLSRYFREHDLSGRE
jgi:RNA polymerase sigma factor (sigma-70 family)